MAMDKLYTEHYQEIRLFYKKLSSTLEELSLDDNKKTIEEIKIHNALYKLNELLGDTEHVIEYCLRDTKEGYLKESPYTEGRFVLDKYELTCGSPLEIFLWGKWHPGRAEYGEEYYFVGCGNPTFSELQKKKVKIRIRI